MASVHGAFMFNDGVELVVEKLLERSFLGKEGLETQGIVDRVVDEVCKFFSGFRIEGESGDSQN
jgi:hypothetical protein